MKKVLGLILELNPLHNGHCYFIEEAKKKVQPDLVVAVVSSSFSMRGDIMVLDKFKKTQLMLELGIDIILELPVISLLNSADYFAYNSLTILKKMNITDLAFGVENDNLEQLLTIAQLLSDISTQEYIKDYLDKGHSYSNSCLKALQEITNDSELALSSTLPNNTLAISYLRALKSLDFAPQIHLIKRIENNYYDQELSANIASATSIRANHKLGIDISKYLPKSSFDFQLIDLNKSEDNLFKLLKYQFAYHDISYFSSILGVDEGIENRFASMLTNCDDLSSFIKAVQTKRYTQNRIRRIIIAIILGIPKSYQHLNNSYLRILGFSSSGKNYIKTLPKDIKTQIITSFKNNDNDLVAIEIKATKIYQLITDQNIFIEEFKVPYEVK